MNRLSSNVRKPVKRQNAEVYLAVTLLSFALSVALTRLFLELTGYPQLGGGGLHFAHVLWGGLLLFIASLLPIILANRWVYLLGALISGAGVGLFIDEVGKFITQSNDYFYPAAAPIVYAFFLLTVLVYLQVRRPIPRDVRTELYHALEEFEEVLDHDLDQNEFTALETRLRYIVDHPDSPEYARLAAELLEFLHHNETKHAPELPIFSRRLRKAFLSFEQKYVKRRRMVAVLAGGLAGLGLVSLIRFFQFFTSPEAFHFTYATRATLIWFLTRLGLEALAALTNLISAMLFIIRDDKRAVAFSTFSLLASLVVINLVVFYFDQFSTIIPAAIQFALLMGVLYYRQHFLKPGV